MTQKSTEQTVVGGARPDWLQGGVQYVGDLHSISKHIPQLSLEERDRRWRRIREEMVQRGLDCLLVWGNDAFINMAGANFKYVTSVSPRHRSLAVFPLKGDPIVYMSWTHEAYYYGVCYTWVRDVRPMAMANDIINIVKELGFAKARIGMVESHRHAVVPYQLWKDVLDGLPEVNFVDESNLLDLLQVIKSPEEIRCMEEAGRIAALAHKAILDTARAGVRECEVYANMKQAMYSNCGEHGLLLVGSTAPNFGHPRCDTLSTRKLEKGDIFMAEYHTTYAGYMTQTERNVSIGKPRKEYLELFKVCKEVYTGMADKLRPGKSYKEAEEAAWAELRKAGVDCVECGIGTHGLNSEPIPPGAEIVAENMTIKVGLNIYNPKWAKGGGFGLASTVLITKDGNRPVDNIPLELAVV